MSYNGTRALVTGGSSGIGLAVARQLADEGADVSILARDPDKLAEATEEIKAARRSEAQTVDPLSADVSDLEQVQQALAPLIQGGRVPDLLINSAGVAHPGYAEELDLKIFHWMMDVNYFGTVHVTQTLLPAMLARGSGHIVNISSIAGFLGVFGYTAYSGSKFAVRGYSDVLRAEMKRKGIDVSIVFPPDTFTPQLEYENKFKPAETVALDGNVKPVAPESVARAILKGVSKRRYIIAPGFDGKFLYWLSGVLGTATYPVMDFMVSRAAAEARKAEEAKPRTQTEGD